MSPSPNKDTIELNGLNFNQDGSCFAVPTKNGYRIFNVEPLKQLVDDKFEGGIKIVEILFRCNYVALVGTGSNIEYPKNKVIIWDSAKKHKVSEIETKTDVKGIKLRRDKICIIMDHNIDIYSFCDNPHRIHSINTWTNPQGISALSPSIDNALLAYPSQSCNGHIGIFNLARPDIPEVNITAHNHNVAEITFNFSGAMIATASEKGTLVRVFETGGGTLVKEFRRGSQPAKILCISFSPDSNFVAVASNHSTIHIFSLQPNRKKSNVGDSVERYFKGDVSFVRLKITPSINSNTQCRCTFGSNSDYIIAVCSDGSFHRFALDQQTRKCIQQTYCFFVELN
uniref:WD repeat domain phosphoinositide-interacting protein 2 n=1 Tax=Panagrolaimus sp. ES5 TaxID=591445 RepID=A0AC34GW28_9BILA